MSFIPTAEFLQQFSVDTRRVPAFSPTVMSNHPENKRTDTLKPDTKSLTANMLRRQLPRARKARVRLRQQNRLRIAVV